MLPSPLLVFVSLAGLYGCQAATFVLYMFRSNGTYIEVYDDCTAVQATFGTQSFKDELTFCAVAADPLLACTHIAPLPANTSTYCINGHYVVTERGNCSFALKAYNAQLAKYSGVLVVNDDEDLFTMAGDGEYDMKVHIPVFMIPRKCGYKVLVQYPFKEGYGLILRLWWSYSSALRFLVPFVVVVTFSFIVLVIIMGIRWHRGRRRMLRRRLTKRQLKSIPTKKFRKGDTVDTCAICLEDFVEGEKIRVLGCAHCYHSACVDPWLLKGRKVCPVCKRNAVDGSTDNSESDSGDDRVTPNEVAPLLLTNSRSSSADSINVQVGNSIFYTDYGSTGRFTLLSPSWQSGQNESGSDAQCTASAEAVDGSAAAATSPVPSNEGMSNPSFLLEEESTLCKSPPALSSSLP